MSIFLMMVLALPHGDYMYKVQDMQFKSAVACEAYIKRNNLRNSDTVSFGCMPSYAVKRKAQDATRS